MATFKYEYNAEPFDPFGPPKSLPEKQENFFDSIQMQTLPVLILDIDGTVRESIRGEVTPQNDEDIRILPNVIDKVTFYKNKGWFIIGVTNQGGVAFNILKPDETSDLLKETNHMMGSPFDMILSCFFHENGINPIFGRRSLLRKPNYGMLVLAESLAFNNKILLDWDASIMVGDREDDRLCAEAAQIEFRWAKDFFKWE